MSYRNAPEPQCQDTDGSVDLAIHARPRDLGGFSVRRVLPAPRRRMVGPFIFFDHMGPADLPPGQGINVRPHPHIGLATITYLFEGQLMHRDSLGFEQAIRPGAVNLMTAGHGIVHSERSGDDLDEASRLHGIQSWIALPEAEEEREPAFEHVAAGSLPLVERDGARIRVIMGEAFGETSPVPVFSPTLYLELELAADARVARPAPRPPGPCSASARPSSSAWWSCSAWSPRCATPTSWWWAARPSANGTSGGTSCPAVPSASSRRKTTGARVASNRSPAIPSSFRYRIN